nr:hypothetical protein Iba_chr13aCG6840 [Ipomoea batatas]GME03766.1 hypothetical protein Iba_scaffold1174CG0020 [Ipomoea batatas]
MEIVPEIQAGQFGNTTTTWGNPRIEEDRTNVVEFEVSRMQYVDDDPIRFDRSSFAARGRRLIFQTGVGLAWR